MRRLLSTLAAAATVAVVGLVGPSPSAAAAPAAPAIVTPAAGSSTMANPVLSWKPVAAATKYEVQLSASSDYQSPAFAQTTANTSATPTSDLPAQGYYWRVRGIDAQGVAGPFAASSFVKTSRVSPNPVYPVDRVSPGLVYPTDPYYFEWQPIPGAKTYEVQVDDDAQFVGAPAPWSTSNTRYSPTTPPVFGTTYYWRVRGLSNSGVASEWSTAASFRMDWAPTDKVELISPSSVETPTIDEVVLDWADKPGAAYYEIEVSPDQNFNAPIIPRQRVNATVYSRALNLPAGAYYWHVRAMSTSPVAEPGPWSDTWVFKRSWPSDAAKEVGGNAQVTLTYPADEDYTLIEPRFAWTPQAGASHYQIQFSPEPTFTNPVTCTTNHTTFVPHPACPGSAPGDVVYWRVRAQDSPNNSSLNGEWTPARSMMYDPTNGGMPVLTPSGSDSTGPVLRWTPLPGIGQYEVSVQSSDGAPGCTSSSTARTFQTVWVPEGLAQGCSYRWAVRGVEGQTSKLTRIPGIAAWSRFTLAKPPTSGGAGFSTLAITGTDGIHPPLLSWSPVDGADGYQVFASPKGANSFALVTTTKLRSTAYANPLVSGPGATVGSWDVKVSALKGTAVLADSDVLSYTVGPQQPAVMTAPAHCPLSSCSSVEYETPMFEWNAVPGAGAYRIYLATDPNFTNITRTYDTQFTRYRPTESLPDSQASQATYWYVRACFSKTGLCAPFDATTFPGAHAFRKISRPVTIIGPKTGSKIDRDEVTFRWNDYLLENQAVRATDEAASYEVQVSTTSNFTNIIDTSPRLDLTTYTAQTKTYPDGPLYWRVRAWDQSNNPLTWSTYDPPVEITKKVPAALQTAPANGATVVGTPVLTWKPESHTASYEVQVYTNPDQPLSSTNLVFSATTNTTSAIPTKALPSGSYAWRVRRIDPNRLPGSWPDRTAEMTRFTVQPAAPVLASPANGASWLGQGGVFTWGPVQGATRYRIDIGRTADVATLFTSATTDMTSWAPTFIYPVWPNGTYYWRVTALDASGAAMATSATRSLVRNMSTVGEFTPISPRRLLTTATSSGPLKAGTLLDVTTTGVGEVPGQGVSAVVLNVTVYSATASSYLTMYPARAPKPTARAMSFQPNRTTSSTITVSPDVFGRVRMWHAAGSAQFAVDIVGYYGNGTLVRGDRLTVAQTPVRIADTRGVLASQPHRPLLTNESRDFQVTGLGGVPADATAVILNVTTYNPSDNSALTLWKRGTARPGLPGLWFLKGRAVRNLVTIPIGTNGMVSIHNRSGSLDIGLDAVGWYRPGDPGPGYTVNPLGPTWIGSSYSNGGLLAANTTRTWQVRGRGGVPSDARARYALLDVTLINPMGSGAAVMWPAPTAPKPAGATHYFVKGQTTTQQVLVPIGSDGKVALRSTAATHVQLDVLGWVG